MEAAKDVLADQIDGNKTGEGDCYLQKFRLYETRSKFYMVGRDKDRTLWRVLTIDRLEPFDLNIREDSAMYSESECNDLLKRIHEGNKSTGGLKFVTSCYGLIGFVKFLGPYYMLLITKRRLLGAICGHNVYAVTKSAMIVVPNSAVRSNMSISKNENRYKKLMCSVDLTKDFFFSYSYHVMRSLQNNLCNVQTGQVLYETMFVWNEFLTRGIRNHLKNTLWTVALVYGFFMQAKLSVLGKKDIRLTLIARRSRHYAGTRYLKRGVNDKGSVANDVETEQIVFEDVSEGTPTQISSIVQNRGSIPLYWSQETSKLNLKPDIVLQKKDENYEATRLHFDTLVKRYGNPIIILNLIKTKEKKPRESILRAEFVNAIDFLNKDLSEENRLRFLHWDLHKHMRSKATNVLLLLGKVATYALHLTGFFYCQVQPVLGLDSHSKWPDTLKDRASSLSYNKDSNHIDVRYSDAIDTSKAQQQEDELSCDTPGLECSAYRIECNNCLIKPPVFQTGILRTNCIDCLDRTNVAQYAYGLTALGHQLHALGLIDIPRIDLDAPLANDLMNFYERMGDTLALQYGGSAAHNKVFSERRGQWKAATQSQEFLRTLQRYYSNAYMDAEKQEAINLFLGYSHPLQDNSAIWDLDFDQNYHAIQNDDSLAFKTPRSLIKRCLSDGSILWQSDTPLSNCCAGEKQFPLVMSDKTHEIPCLRRHSDSTPEISACEKVVSYSRYTPTMPCRRLFVEKELGFFSELEFDASTSSNFLDLEGLSSSGNSYVEETDERSTVGSTVFSSPIANLSTDNVINGLASESTPPSSENESSIKSTGAEINSTDDIPKTSDTLREFSDSFVSWVINGETLSLA
ncbi:Phosphoinositide phosphatase SAC3 [Apostasia shenzhenica]|uniref:Phosphoinositide phosphatase SAC3 n=1 Tax=Apostasia shenzhenica TaxID=1088818 RepID=A0A2I0AET6_9ASPA|nr:Phosphoinositide phosphatase SAC3 [Apostasia shenzhenica]